MKMLLRLGACALALALSGCTSQTGNCAVGYNPTFHLTVRYSKSIEPAVRFCDDIRCSRIPGPGAPARAYNDPQQQNAPTLVRTAKGEWAISPNSNGQPPTTATIELYVNGKKASTTTVHLTWPAVDPCSTNNPPAPHPTLSLR